ncbi:MAG: DUF4249 domain-containing protein [Bacteroidales bacterium]|jgi:hypothetical protein|nr:DUF4249 domain-containing protein [Bacteroidales bacterium]MDY0313550.1 DUF4249 domain-containing protein [Bacteroidales bacterium]
MKTNIFKYSLIFIIFTSIVFIIACEKTIEIDIEDTKPKLVLNAELNPDSTIKVNITRSRHILDNAMITNVEDAQVKIYEDEIFIGNLIYDKNGNYRLNYKPKKGKNYKIIVEHPNYETVKATSFIISKIENISIDTSSTYDEYGNSITNLNIKFKDPANEKNYYMLKLRDKYKTEIWDYSIIVIDTIYTGPDTTIVNISQGAFTYEYSTEVVYFSSNDINLDEDNYFAGVLAISDELFDGKEYLLKTSFDANYTYYSTDTSLIYIDFYSISQDYYKYIKSRNKYTYSVGDPFSEPVMVFTNVENGLGILGSAHANTDSILIKRKNYFYYE